MVSDENPPIAADSPAGYNRGNRRQSRSTNGGGNSLGTLVGNAFLILLVLGLLVSGWFIFQQNQELAGNQQALADAAERLKKLEQRLRLTDETMSEAGADTSKQINLWEDEIRKLWDVSNKRNKKWIEENRTAVRKQTADLSTVETSLRKLKSDVSQHEGAFEKQQDIVDTLTAMELRVTQIVERQREITDKANLANQVASRLKAGLENRVEENEQAIKAIDAYRLQINSRVADLQRRVENSGL